ncbi:MAG: DUF3379 family protein [Pseudohongiella sp.]|nr:DUF3379 family protein [Pseudohongiella sp.]MDP2128576.1 DUF3379 family protein [Pseudohongiella sp.]
MPYQRQLLPAQIPMHKDAATTGPAIMDDLEFHTRAHCNPDDTQQDFLDALTGRADRQQLLDEVRVLDQQLKALSASLTVPPQLKQSLLKTAQPSVIKRNIFALAASLVLAVGFAVSTMQYSPSADELAMHDAMIEHLVHEEPRYIDAQPIQWSEVEAVLASADIKLHLPENTLIVTFANLCGLGNNRRAVHLVAMGEHGPVSMLLIHSPPIGGNMEVRDNRFKGRIVPASAGNMAVVGEKDEKLDKFERLISNSVQWSI